MNELYYRNRDFKEYIDLYCEKHHITKEVAFEHAIIKAIALMHETKTQKHREGGTV